MKKSSRFVTLTVWIMPYCCAVGCRNDERSGKSFFRFPKDRNMHKNWIAKVKRKDWKPTKTTVLCSDHFERDAYETDPELLRSLGFSKQPRLRQGAMPTLFNYMAVNHDRVKRRGAFEKRRRQQVLHEMLNGAERHDASSESENEMNDLPEIEASSTEPVEGSHKSFGIQTCLLTADKSLQTQKSLFPGTRTYSRGTQVSPVLQHFVGTQCSIQPSTVSRGTQYNPPDESGDSEEFEADEEDDMCTDPDYDFNDDVDMESDEDDMDEHAVHQEIDIELEDGPGRRQKKFIVYESCIKTLLASCFLCLAQCRVAMKRVCGSFVALEQVCVNGHKRLWESQPFLGAMPAGNLMMASGIFASGSSAVRTVNMFKHLNIPSISVNTFNLMQRNYLVPATRRVWQQQQAGLTAARQGEPISLGGDARCCSPGHTAKYGSYTLMDLKSSKVLEMQLLQSNQVKNSNAMELAGLKLAIKSLVDKGLDICSITTDRHLGVKKYLREEQPEIQHWFDVWHVAKGVKKKLLAKGKRKDCQILSEWSRSISNHVYWCAASSNGDEAVVRAKWLSVTRHVVNEHSGHGADYPECEHELLEDRNWVKKGSKPHKEMELIVNSKHLLKDIGRLSPSEQTSSLESFHKVVIFFAPKSVHFPFATMEARLLIAVLHFNENSNRAQAVTQQGQAQWGVSFPKARQGDPVVKPVKVPITFDYVDDLITEVFVLREKYPSYRLAKVLSAERSVPPPIAAQFEKPAKDILVGAHRCHFNHVSKISATF